MNYSSIHSTNGNWRSGSGGEYSCRSGRQRLGGSGRNGRRNGQFSMGWETVMNTGENGQIRK